MNKITWKVSLMLAVLFFSIVAIPSCGNSKKKTVKQLCFNCPSTGQKTLTISWDANREKDVNATGGGYNLKVTCGGTEQDFSIPYVSGATAPTSYDVTVCSGYFNVQVQGYSALNPAGGDWSPVKTITVK